MFGYYAILCWETESFWMGNINKWSPYWKQFHRFYRDMKAESERELASSIKMSRERISPLTRPGSTSADASGPGPPVRIVVPPQLRPAFGGHAQLNVVGSTVADVIKRIVAEWPDTSQLLTEARRPAQFMNVYLNGEDIRFLDGGYDAPVTDADELVILPAIQGG